MESILKEKEGGEGVKEGLVASGGRLMKTETDFQKEEVNVKGGRSQRPKPTREIKLNIFKGIGVKTEIKLHGVRGQRAEEKDVQCGLSQPLTVN